jgi:hypothetical protein
MQNQSGMNDEVCRKALVHFKRGLEQLDQAGAPGDIGAHVDLAICRLEETLAASNCEIATLRAANGS